MQLWRMKSHVDGLNDAQKCFAETTGLYVIDSLDSIEMLQWRLLVQNIYNDRGGYIMLIICRCTNQNNNNKKNYYLKKKKL